MNIGFFGGSFNPVHNGHVKMAEEFIKRAELDRLLIVPTGDPFYKFSLNIAAANDRFNMCLLAFENYENIEISDMEFVNGGRTYTFDTLFKIKEMYNEPELFMLVGSDVLNGMMSWYKSDLILNMAHVCSFCRPGFEFEDRIKSKVKSGEIDVTLYDEKMPDISSTMVRKKIKNGESISGLVDPKVEEYIYKNCISEIWK